MPIFESQCAVCGEVREWYAHHASDENPICECGGETQRLISRFGVVFTGALSAGKYNDPKLEGAHSDGHWVWRKKTVSGHPEPQFISTWSERKEFMKSEGLVGHEDVGPVDPSPDGKWSSGRTGSPGTWV